MSPLERIAEAYWNAHRDGFVHVGGNPADYPKWSSAGDPETRKETMRCLRHALAVLWELPPPTSPNPQAAYDMWIAALNEHFPERLEKRRARNRKAA